jgi:hypothetical protein
MAELKDWLSATIPKGVIVNWTMSYWDEELAKFAVGNDETLRLINCLPYEAAWIRFGAPVLGLTVDPFSIRQLIVLKPRNWSFDPSREHPRWSCSIFEPKYYGETVIATSPVGAPAKKF